MGAREGWTWMENIGRVYSMCTFVSYTRVMEYVALHRFSSTFVYMDTNIGIIKSVQLLLYPE